MPHADVPFVTSCDRQIKDMSESELIALFSWYDFKDHIGHKLTMCADFLDLVKSITERNQP